MQQTIRESFTLSGVGIHTGEIGRVTVHPAEVEIGRIFVVNGIRIPADVDCVVDTRRCTVLGRDGATVSTVEHLLSALAGCGIDNTLIEVDGPEIPILDGSALPFVQAVLDAGIEGQTAPARTLPLSKPLTLSENGSEARVAPFDDYALTVTTAFADWSEGETTQQLTAIGANSQQYYRSVAPARTFAFRKEVEWLQSQGLAKGGSLENALIITLPDGANANQPFLTAQFSTPLRLPAEWGAHKLLDALGDLALLNARLQAQVSILRPGHRFNTELARRIRDWAAATQGGKNE